MSATFYTTTEFAILRAVSSGHANTSNIPSELNVIVPELIDCRKKAQNSVCGNNRKDFTDTCLKAWDLLSTLSSPSLRNKYALPSRYNSESFDQLLQSASKSLYAMETGARSVGNNYILNGLKGVGKTCMLHAMGAIAACVCKHIFPTYWIYEKRTPKEPANPYTLIEAARLLYKLELDDLRNSSFDSIVLNLMPDGTDMGSTDSRDVSKFFLLLDEITCLYIPIKGHDSSEEISRRETYCFVLGQLREIARKGM